jgi:hypothetical protein
MKTEEVRNLLNRISNCCKLDLNLGLNAFIERASVWSEGYNILIRFDAIYEGSFERLISTIKKLDKHWRLVERAEEPFFLIYGKNDEK